MRKFYFIALTFLLVLGYQTKAQNSFSFACARDTLITDCSAACITVKARIPDVRSSTNSYVINSISGAPGGCYVPYVDPGLPGTPTNLTIDDTYSGVISIPFTFPFYGIPYNSLVASTNGYVSFDITRAGLFSHYSTAAGDLPNTGYDRALIMGPYHDLDPAYTTSPTMRIKYETLGTAPHRKWILSFYKVPLFLTPTCSVLIENTHQIVIYEGLGIAEVFVTSKQICTGWNNGKSMIGMQDYNRTSAIMAPGRKVSDPAWGSIGMNESWRFTPASGPTLYRKVELFDITGTTLISTGDTTSIGNNTFQVTFPNVCPTTTTSYIVKSTYQDINNASGFVIGTDTIRVVRPNAINTPAIVTNAKCNAATDASFTINPTGSVGPFQYSLNGGVTYQASNVFSGLAAGVYNVRVQDIGTSCIRDTMITITEPLVLDATAPTTNSTCSATPNGIITVNASGGTTNYSYSLDGTTFQSSNIFTVAEGNYTVTIKDANGCTKTVPVTVTLTDNLTVQTRSDTTICRGASIQLTTTSNAATYSWTPASSLNDATLASPMASPTSDTHYTVTAVLGQCTKTDDVDVIVKQDVSVDAGPTEVSILSGDFVQIFATATGASSYLWTPATGLSSATILSPIAQPAITTLYTLTATNSVGCYATDDILIKVIPYCIKVKNAFTPNGDGINDLWLVYDNYECLKNIKVHVFNRYGNSVFESNDYHNDWDGRYKGKSLPDATYYAVIDFLLVNGKTTRVKTDLTILR